MAFNSIEMDTVAIRYCADQFSSVETEASAPIKAHILVALNAPLVLSIYDLKDFSTFGTEFIHGLNMVDTGRQTTNSDRLIGIFKGFDDSLYVLDSIDKEAFGYRYSMNNSLIVFTFNCSGISAIEKQLFYESIVITPAVRDAS